MIGRLASTHRTDCGNPARHFRSYPLRLRIFGQQFPQSARVSEISANSDTGVGMMRAPSAGGPAVQFALQGQG